MKKKILSNKVKNACLYKEARKLQTKDRDLLRPSMSFEVIDYELKILSLDIVSIHVK